MTEPATHAGDTLATLDDLDVAGKRVLLRVDLNVPRDIGPAGAPPRVADSTEGIAHRLPSAAGRLMESEVRVLHSIIDDPQPPVVASLGGAKVSDKIGVVARFLEIADVVCIGGAMAFPFLAVQGHPVGASVCADSDLEPARHAIAMAGDSDCRLELPEDFLLAESPDADAPRRLDGVDVPDGWIGLDIGPSPMPSSTPSPATGRTSASSTSPTPTWSGTPGRSRRRSSACRRSTRACKT